MKEWKNEIMKEWKNERMNEKMIFKRLKLIWIDKMSLNFDSLSISTNMSPFIEFDIDMIIYCLKNNFISVLPYIHSKTLQNRDLVIIKFRDESKLFKHIIDSMNQKIESVDYYDVMPLIDEYIDIVFDNK